MQRHCSVRGWDAFCWQPWEPPLLLFLSLVSTYPSQPLSAAGVPARAAVVQESCEGLGEDGKEERRREDVEGGENGRQLPAVREGSEEAQCSVSWSVILTTNYFHGVFWPKQSRTSCNWAWSSASRHNLQSQCVQPRFGWVLIRVFLASQGSDYQSLRMNGSWCHCWLRTKTTSSCREP